MQVIRIATTSDMLLHKNKKAIAIPGDYSYDEGTLRVLGEKKTLVVLVALDQLLKSHGMARSRLLYRLRNFLGLCVRFGVLFLLGFEEDIKSSSWSVREKEEVIALGQMLGLNRGQAKMAVERFEDLFIAKPEAKKN